MTVKIAQERKTICKSNKCGKYDPNGTSEAAFIKGVESCGSCGCVLLPKVFSMDSECPEGLWGKSEVTKFEGYFIKRK